MNNTEFNNILNAPGKPLVIEFWAAWCGPCRAMEPNLEKTADEFEGSVSLVRINVDDDVEIAQTMKIYAIPTMIAYKDGKELFRKTGSQSLDSLHSIFLSASNGTVEVKSAVSPMARFLRLINWFFILGGALIAFWGVYDRCPIYNSIKAWIKSKSIAPGLDNPPSQ
jgi:thioredoxin